MYKQIILQIQQYIVQIQQYILRINSAMARDPDGSLYRGSGRRAAKEKESELLASEAERGERYIANDRDN